MEKSYPIKFVLKLLKGWTKYWQEKQAGYLHNNTYAYFVIYRLSTSDCVQ